MLIQKNLKFYFLMLLLFAMGKLNLMYNVFLTIHPCFAETPHLFKKVCNACCNLF